MLELKKILIDGQSNRGESYDCGIGAAKSSGYAAAIMRIRLTGVGSLLEGYPPFCHLIDFRNLIPVYKRRFKNFLVVNINGHNIRSDRFGK